jgi:anti-anti-sigma regulatory factor
LNKRVQAAEGRLILCGLHPFVREAFHDSRLERVFEISDDLEAALASP